MNDLPDVHLVRSEMHTMFPSLDNWLVFMYADQITAMVRGWDSKNLINRWAEVNALSTEQREYLRSKDIPKWSVSKRYVRHGNGDEPANRCRPTKRSERKPIIIVFGSHLVRKKSARFTLCCDAGQFQKRLQRIRHYRLQKTMAADSLALRSLKTDVLVARKTTGCCVNVRPDETASGMKLFRHGQKYPAPLNAQFRYGRHADKVSNHD